MIAPATVAAHPAIEPPRTPLTTLPLWAVLLALLAGSWKGADMRPLDLFRDASNMAQYASGFFPPDFHEWRQYLAELVVTLQIALWGTALAIVCAAPLSLLAAANGVRAAVRRRRRARSVRRRAGAVGAHDRRARQALLRGRWISYALYRFESNVRSASVVGMVGAGGIGMVLWDVIRGFQYAQTAAVLILLALSVSAIDLVSAQLRKRMI
jgi:phosphonate transport system permease protein